MTYARYKTGSYHNYGTIIGAQGIYFSGPGSTLINSGSIAGTSGNAVRLANGGRLANAGSISGSFEGVNSSAAMYLTNTNYIHGTDWGVVTAGGTVFNSGDGFTTVGRIGGGIDGVLSTAYATVGNGYGSIYGGRFGLNLENGGSVSNDIGGISGGTTAIYVQGNTATVTNAGNVLGGLDRSGDGIDLLASGRITNSSAGNISTSGGRAIYSYARDQTGFVFNYGAITASGDRSIGVYLKGNTGLDIAGGHVSNEAGGSITGYVGISITNGGYVYNAGAITGTGSYGCYIKASGYVNNVLGGTITGATTAVREAGSDSRVFNAGLISGEIAVFLNDAGAEVANFAGGTIAGLDAVVLGDGGSVFNEKSGSHIGTISGSSYYGVLVEGAAGYVNNSGVIRSFYRAIALEDGGSVVNAATGTISGYGGFPGRGVVIYGATGNVTNSGSINGAGYYGVLLSLSGSGALSNAASGHITGALDGLHGAGAAMSVTNSGTISGGRYGIYFGAGGSLLNKVGATVSGGSAGVVVAAAAATVTNAGTIDGGSFAVRLLGSNETLIVDPGAVFGGTVSAAGAGGAMVLASGASAGSISKLGTAFAGFASITERSGATWNVTGQNTLAASTELVVAGTLAVKGTLVAPGSVSISGAFSAAGTGSVQLGDNVSMVSGSTLSCGANAKLEIGTVGGAAAGRIRIDAAASLVGAGTVANPLVINGAAIAQGGVLSVTGAVSGSGSLDIKPNATASLAGALSASDLVFLGGGHETAVFGNPTGVSATISGFTLTSDVMDLTGFVATGKTFAGHTLTLNRSGGTAAHLLFAGSYTSAQFSIGTDSHGGTLLKFV